MKLDDLVLAPSLQSDAIYLGTVDGNNWVQKMDFTGQVLKAFMQWTPPGSTRVIHDSNGNWFEISVVQVDAPSIH